MNEFMALCDIDELVSAIVAQWEIATMSRVLHLIAS